MRLWTKWTNYLTIRKADSVSDIVKDWSELAITRLLKLLYVTGTISKTFDYQSFIEKFDDVELRAKRSAEEKDKITLLETDINIAERGIEGGLSSKEVAKVLKIYGTHRCKEEKYLKAVMKKIQDKEISLDFGR